MTTDDWLAGTRTSYDTVAASYAAQVRGALADDAYACAALDLFAGSVRAGGGGPVADVGCGPGHVTAHLHALGVDAPSESTSLLGWSTWPGATIPACGSRWAR